MDFNNLNEQEMLILITGVAMFVDNVLQGDFKLDKRVEMSKLYPSVFPPDKEGNSVEMSTVAHDLYDRLLYKLMEENNND